MLTFLVDFNDIEGEDQMTAAMRDLQSGWLRKPRDLVGSEVLLSDGGHSCRAIITAADGRRRQVVAKMDWTTWRSSRTSEEQVARLTYSAPIGSAPVILPVT